uniref:non-specific serine/threonine protein kinase n=1 Tax=Dermatophagoides pteronyssinus TaxID=6956 RepID=A0A6P6XSF5_DERPT|nr:serine/threonine-protein kinase SMG1-like [Dermatophagoides pteronyssinus]
MSGRRESAAMGSGGGGGSGNYRYNNQFNHQNRGDNRRDRNYHSNSSTTTPIKSYYSNGLIGDNDRRRNVSNERQQQQQHDADDDTDESEKSNGYNKNGNFSHGKHPYYHHQNNQNNNQSQQRMTTIPIQCQNDLQNFLNIIRPFTSLTEKKSWPNTFKDLTIFYRSAKSMRNNIFIERIFTESLRAFEKIFKEKLYKNTVEEMIDCMAALCDSLETSKSDLFEWIFKIYFQQSTSEENRLIILRCLSSIMINCQMIAMDNYFFIQLKLKKSLETTNNIEIFLQILELIIVIGQRSPNSLQRHIEDLMDILLGWYLDGHQTIMTLYLIENIILSFDFKNHLKFSNMLLRSFIEDVEKYFHESMFNLKRTTESSSKANVESINSRLHTMALRIRLFAIFYRKIFMENRKECQKLMLVNTEQNFQFCIDSMAIIIKVIINLSPYKSLTMFEELLIECNQSIIILMETFSILFDADICFRLLEKDCHDYCQILFDIMDIQISSKKSIITGLDFIRLFVKNSKNINDEIVDKLFCLKFQSLKFSMDKNVQQSFISLFFGLLKIKSVEIIDKSYRHILSNIKVSFNFLQKIKQKNENENFVPIIKNLDLPQQDQPYHSIITNEQKCLIGLYVDLILLTEIANTKHSLIAMLALSPNFLELMLYHINLSNEWLADEYSSIHHSLLYLFCSYCQKHHNFLPQSSLFVNQSSSSINNNNNNVLRYSTNSNALNSIFPLSNIGSILDNHHSQSSLANTAINISSSNNNNSSLRFSPNSHASNYFVDIIKNLKSILSINKLKMDSIIVCLRLCENIVQYFGTVNKQSTTVIALDEFVELIEIVSEYSFANDYQICRLSCTIAKNLMPLIDDQSLSLYWQVFYNYRRACEFNLAHTDNNINHLFLDLLSLLPVCSMTKTRLKIPNQIRSTLCYLPLISNNLDMIKIFQYNYWTAIFWICFEFVQLCIENRLKTPLGKPQDTFTKIESLIKMFVAEISTNSNVNRLQINATNNNQMTTSKPNTIRIHMLLMIMDNFDKLIYNAIHGNSLRLYCSSKLSKQFFKKNRATCSEWLNRNRRSIMVLASKVGQLSIVVHHGQELLRNYQSDRTLFTLDEIEFILLLMIDALIQMKASETIRGYYNWVKQYLAVKFVWIKAATDEANGRYERALIQYRNLLQDKVIDNGINVGGEQQQQQSSAANLNTLNLISSSKNFICNSYTVNFFRKRILNCLLNIENYDNALEWWKSTNCESNKTNINQMATNLFGSANIDYSYLKSLSTFTTEIHNDNDDDKNCRMTNDIVTSIDQLQQQQQRSMFFDIESSYHQIQSKLFQFANEFYQSYNDDNNVEMSKKFVEKLDDLIGQRIDPLIRSFNMCGMSVEIHFAMLQKISHQLRAIIQPPPTTTTTSEKIRFDLFEWEDLNIDQLINGLSWYRVFAKLNEKTNHIEQDNMKYSLNRLLLKTARKARKTQNMQLAEELLFQFANVTALMNVNDHSLENNNRLINIVQNSLNNTLLNQNLLDFCYETSEYLYDKQEQESAINILLKSVDILLETTSKYTADSNNNNKTMSECTSRIFLKLVHYIQSDSNECCCLKQFEKLDMNTKFLAIDEKMSCIRNLNYFDNISGKLLLLSVNNCPSMAKAWYQLGDWCYRWGRRLSDIDTVGDVGGGEQSTTTTATTTMMTNVIESSNGREANIIEFYKLAANSYIRFLHISGHNGCDDIDATLRLLRLILKHAPELREILEIGLKETPTKPWKNITLQLFSRLNHHEPYVRQSICELLCRIGSDSPHLIIFPAITGLLDDQVKSKNFDYTSTKNEDEDEDDEEVNSTDIDQSLVRNCYTSLLDTLSQRDPKLIVQAKLFVHELRRITVLWDELWIGILQHGMNEMKKQVVALEKEIEKTRKNINLYEKEKILFIKEQHNIFFRRLLYSLQLTNMLTSDTPETPHEEWFQKNFNQLINQLIESIANPENIYEPSNILFNYQNLFQTIRKRSLASNNYRFYMHDISPRLATLDNTIIPLPGLNGSNVMLKGVFKTVSILHTYTKPKKIILIGSDGRNYSYLFKGHEDLHLDERIMQFLSIINQMIAKFGPTISQQNNNINNDRLFIRARHYSVTPLGNKSGLIQWVEGGHALYNLYKRWLSNREISLDDINKRITANEIFKCKLAEHGMTSENRNDWNTDLLRKVFDELSTETPNDLIAKELWCSSVNSFDHWNLTQNFITSNAIMSVIGYILGLGDRHLDNILLDLTTGEVIHIDYNICFEKGKTLRVPEMVLCRLTQNIVNTFGVTGVDGTFRISCENVLKILRKGKETLLTLLEAFVYDPLIDWTPEHEEGFTGAIYGGAKIAQLANEGKIIPKKQMEKENQEAIERLKQLMKSVEQRNSDWPKINNEEPQQDLQILANQAKQSDNNKNNQQQQVIETRKNKRNVYAFSVWKRIRMKLDGRDPDPNKRLSIYDQVNHLINESISMENLSRMYEGWTSWV